jgi:hypothetical protein
MKRAAAKKLIERYFYQVTDGCGDPDCNNVNCVSSGKVNFTQNTKGTWVFINFVADEKYETK